jgi:hypothetical protein
MCIGMALGSHKQERPAYRWDALLTGQHSVPASGAAIGTQSTDGAANSTEKTTRKRKKVS